MEESFPGPVQVSLLTAEKWTKEYQSGTEVEESNDKVKAFLIPRESLKKVLALNTDAVRAYIGLNDQKEKTLLFVGANKDEKGTYRDVFGPASKKKKMNSDDDLVVYDGTRICPPFDDPNSPL